MILKKVAMLWMTVAAACMAALLAPVSALSPRLPWFDAEDVLPQELSEDEPIWRRDLGDELMAEKRALSVLSRWKPFTDTFRNSGRPSRAHNINEFLPRGLEVVSAETRGTLRPHGQPLRWGRRR
ncbi:uncharacterized protein LOC128992528 [Macrosteles quadrilineatus]|uniref:uncharacterized protein LOC128992528 n=1 Tax=Macrosteles quadrilineatus TaxID=74068 RepID=UPI0023E192C2|nr:uncharacterized protein LOC128992528 [Macrosteles quadrilineatus]